MGRDFLEDLNSFPCPVPHVPAGITEGLSALLEGEGESFSQDHVCPVGDARTCRLKAFCLVNGDQRGILVVHEDVTEERAYERRVHDAERLAGIGLLAGGLAHDFNNLLTAIVGSAEIIDAELDDRNSIDGEVREIKAAARRGAALTHQLLAFSRRQPSHPRVVDLNQVLLEMQPMLSRLLTEEIRLRFELDQQVASVKGDVAHLEQVVMNLVLNARDAMPDGGLLTVSTECLRFRGLPASRSATKVQGPQVRLTVTDTGEGMTQEVQDQLFEPFFTTKEPGKGTGLGLPTVHGVVSQHGGEITVDSSPGAGTFFHIHLPWTDEPLSGEEPASVRAGAERGSETILLVDDDDSVRRIVHRILERFGYSVLESATPEGALVLADEHVGPIDLCLTDVVMPGMSGWDVARALHERKPGLPVLFMSGYAKGEVGVRTEPGDELPFIRKPFSTDELVSAVRAALERSGN